MRWRQLEQPPNTCLSDLARGWNWTQDPEVSSQKRYFWAIKPEPGIECSDWHDSTLPNEPTSYQITSELTYRSTKRKRNMNTLKELSVAHDRARVQTTKEYRKLQSSIRWSHSPNWWFWSWQATSRHLNIIPTCIYCTYRAVTCT